MYLSIVLGMVESLWKSLLLLRHPFDLPESETRSDFQAWTVWLSPEVTLLGFLLLPLVTSPQGTPPGHVVLPAMGGGQAWSQLSSGDTPPPGPVSSSEQPGLWLVIPRVFLRNLVVRCLHFKTLTGRVTGLAEAELCIKPGLLFSKLWH